MKSDMELQKDVVAELKWEPRLREEEIGIAVREGVVTLTGTVPDYAQRRTAAQAAERVAGVRAVAQDLTVRVPDVFLRSDTELAHQVVNALAWDVEVPRDAIKAHTSPYDVAQKIKAALHRGADADAQKVHVAELNGRVVLTGTVRSWPERADVERAAWSASGVTAVDDRLAVVF